MKRLFCVLILSFVIVGCNLNPFLGVGATVDTVAPVLKISSHENFQYVSGDLLHLYGICSDNLKVTSTLLKAEYNDELIFTWEIQNPSSPWNYMIRLNPQADIKAQMAAGTKAEKFELPDGEYKFTVFAHDANDNTSSTSYDTRTLVVDNEPSVAEITYPPLKTSLGFYVGELNRSPQTEGADSYDFNNSEFFRNGDFYIQGNVDDNYGVAELTLTLTEYDETNNKTGKSLSVSVDSSMEMKVNSNIEKQLLDVDASKKPTSLWNWKIYFKETAKTEADITKPRYYKAGIKVKDSAGNEEERDKGFLCVLPKTDFPYTIFPGYGDKIPVGTALSGTCYDDDGIRSIKISLCNTSGEVIDGKEDFYDENVVAGTTAYTWKMDKSTPKQGGSYVVKVEVVDINGRESSYAVNENGDYLHDEKYRQRDLNVIDLTAPSVDITAKKGKDENAKNVDFDDYADVVDEKGDFRVSVAVTDAAQVCKVYLARVLANAAKEDVAKLSEINPKTGNIKPWDLSGKVDGIKFYNLYEYSDGGEVLSTFTADQPFNVFKDFKYSDESSDTNVNEFATKRFYVYAENASGKTTVSYKSLLKEPEQPKIIVNSPLQGSTLTVPFDVSADVSDFSGIKDLTIECSQSGTTIKTMTFADLQKLTNCINKGEDGNITIKLSSKEIGTADKFQSGSCTLTFTATDNYGNKTTEKRQFFVDKNTPFIKNVITTPKTIATYKAGNTVEIRVEMSKAVTVKGGTPTLSLNNGGTATYSSEASLMVDGNYLVFKYEVKEKNNEDTDLLNCTALNLPNGTTIKDAQGQEMGKDFNFPSNGIGSLANNAKIKIDTVAPTITSIKSITPNGSYKADSKIEIQVFFSENVAIDTTNGVPGLALNAGNGAIAEYDPDNPGNGNNKAVFVYTVRSGDNAEKLAWTDWVSNGAVITDSATGAGGKGNEFAFNKESDVKNYQWSNKLVIDTTAPHVEKIESSFTSNSLADGGCLDGNTYYCNAGKQINLYVTFSEPVKVSGTVSLSLNLQTGSTAALYSNGSGTNKLCFIYTVAAGDNTAEKDVLKITAVTGEINDNAGNKLTALSGEIKDNNSNAKNIKIDTTAPKAPQISVPTANAKNSAGTSVYTGLNGGKTTGVEVSASDIAADTYSYCWEDNGMMVDNYSEYGSDGIKKTFGSGESEGFYQEYNISLKLKDKAGNESALSAVQKFIIDTDKPKLMKAVPSVAARDSLKTSVTGTYTAGEIIYVSLVFNKDVTAAGVKVKLNNEEEVTLGTSATHIDGSADYYLYGKYTPKANESLTENLKITEVTAGSVTDCFNNTLSKDALNSVIKATGFENIDISQEIKIDSVAPTINSVSSSKANGWYTVGAIIPITVEFSEAVKYTGTTAPTLGLSNNATADYVSGSGTNSWIFNYEVKDKKDTGDSSAETPVYLKASSITGTITDLAGVSKAGNALDTAMPTDNNFSGNNIGIDTKAPEALVLKAVYSKDKTELSDKATVSGDSGKASVTVEIESGRENKAVIYVTENGDPISDWTETFDKIECKPGEGEILTYTIAAKQRDKAGNVSPEASITFTIDNSPILLESITTTHANGPCKKGDKIELELNFNKEVKVSKNVTVTLNATNGGKSKTVTIEATGTYSKKLTGFYTVAEGDVTTEVLNVSALEGTVVDRLTGNLELNKSDDDGKVALDTATNLAATKQITIDTASPTLTSITTTNANGWYKAGDAIVVILTFNEDVKIGDTEPSLTMSNNKKAIYQSGKGQTMNFVYTVAVGDTTGSAKNLKVSSISGNILDTAGNTFGNTVPTDNFNGKQIGIDTQINPITILCDNSDPDGKSYLDTKTLNIDGLTDSGSGLKSTECTVNGESKILTVTNGTATLSCQAVSGANTNYTVKVTATDNAGNVSSKTVSLAIDGEEIKPESITTTTVSGTYPAGTVIPIKLAFNKDVKVAQTLTLTLSNGKKLTVEPTTSYSNELIVPYTVAAGDDCESLNVMAITGKVADSRSKELSTFDLSKVTTIVDTRSINIDTKVPTIKEITTTASGWYNEGKNIRFTVTCSEIVNVTGTPYLTLSSGGTAQYQSGSGSKSLAFLYTVQSGETTRNSQELTVDGISETGTIADIAKNNLSETIPAKTYAIGIDTVAPNKLTISGIENNSTVTTAESLSIGTFGDTGSGIYSYTISINGTPATINVTVSETLAFSNLPQNIKDKLTVTNGGKQSFTVSVYQTDNAGNASAVSDTLSFTIDTNKAKLLSVTSSKSNETCKEGASIEISLKFSRAIVNGAPTITLSNGKKLSTGTWSTDSTTYTATYTVGTTSAENTTALTITGITGTINDGVVSQDMSTLWSSTDTTTTNLSSYNIAVDTVAPTLVSSTATYSDSTGKATLTYVFSENISKVVGKKITLQREAYVAPIVLSVSEYNEYHALTAGNIATYYEKTVNGWINNKADSTPKYVLKYEYDPTNASLVNYFKGFGYYKQEIVMESSAVTVSGNKVTITTDTLMTGETYTVTAESGMVKDSVGHVCGSIGQKTFTSGNKPQPPVIRVNKISGRGNTADKTTMKINSVTKDATVSYSISTSGFIAPTKTYMESDFVTVTLRGETYKGLELSNSNNIHNSYSCYISAKARKGGTDSDVSYERAFKTVIRTSPNFKEGDYSNNSSIKFYVFRGGDQPSGSNTVDNFPLTWDEKSVPDPWGYGSSVNDTLENGLAEYGMLLADSSSRQAITWGVTDKLYFHGLGCKVSGSKLLWKWQEQNAVEVNAGGDVTDTNKVEASFHDRDGENY